MPYLLQVRGQAGESLFTVDIPADLIVAEPVDLTVAPTRVSRARDHKLALTVANRSPQPAALRVQFAPPEAAKVTPPEIAVDVPAAGTSEADLTLTLGGNASLGELPIPYTIASEDARFRTDGALTLTVTEALSPGQRVSIQRTATPPA
jgi:hypothetical protein